MNGAAYLEIIRPVNAVVAGLAGILAVVIATGMLPPAALVVFVVIVLATGAGNVINDYYDVEIDAINRPDRAIPSGRISLLHARVYAGLLFLSANIVAFIGASRELFLIAFLNSVLLWLYAARLKQTAVIGNVTVSYLSASIFLFGGAILGPEGIIATLPIAGATFFAMNARELIKDVEDMPGDAAAGARTFPILFGLKPALYGALISCLLGVLVSVLPAYRWGIWYLAGILPVDLFLLYAAATALSCNTAGEIRSAGISGNLKKGMFASLVVFLFSAVLL